MARVLGKTGFPLTVEVSMTPRRRRHPKCLDALWNRGPWFGSWSLFPFVLFFSVAMVSCKCEIGAAKAQVLLAFNLLIGALILVGTIFDVKHRMIAVLLSAPVVLAVLINDYTSFVLGH